MIYDFPRTHPNFIFTELEQKFYDHHINFDKEDLYIYINSTEATVSTV